MSKPEVTPEASFISDEDALAAVEELEARSAMLFRNMANAFISVQNQVATQSQFIFELAKAKYGVEPSAEALQFKEAMDAEGERQAAAYAEQVAAQEAIAAARDQAIVTGEDYATDAEVEPEEVPDDE